MLKTVKSASTSTPWYSAGGHCIMIGCLKNKKLTCKVKNKECILLKRLKENKAVEYTVYEDEI